MIKNRIHINKILSILGFVSIIIALAMIIIIPQANTFEISIYNVYPFYFWILLSIPTSILFLKIIMEKEFDFYTLIILIAALLSLIIVLMLPLIRGYPLYGAGDTLSHLGMVKDIEMTGMVGITNPYPIIHILLFSISAILGVSSNNISLILPSIFIILYIISLFILSKSLEFSKKESMFILIFSIIPVLGTGLTTEYIMPSLQSFFLFPLTLFVFFKSRNSNKKAQYSLILVILLILLSLFHPESLIFLVVFFITIFIVYMVKKRFKLSNETENKFINLKQGLLNSILILIIATIAWFSSNYLFGVTLQNIIGTFILNLNYGSPPVITLASGFNISFLDSLIIIIKTYGASILYIFIGLLSSLLVIKNVFKGKIEYHTFLLSSVLFAFIITNLIFLIKGTSIGFHPFRQMKYSLMISTLILGFSFPLFMKNAKKLNKVLPIIVIILICILPSFSLFNLYPTPNIQQYNYQTTYSDIQGMNFFLNNRNKQITVIEPITRSYQTRISDYILGYESKKNALSSGYNDNMLPPPHFGYDINDKLGDSYKSSKYLLVYPPSLDYYPEIYPNYKNLWKLTPEDFRLLKNDNSVNQIYSNEKFTINIINP
jgi:hypothetical protein